MSISFLDIGFLVILAACIIGCTLRGFVSSFISKAGFLVSIIVAFSFTPQAENLVKKWLDMKYVTTIVTFIGLFIIAYLIMLLVQAIIKKIFSGKILGALDKVLGCVWGIFLAFFIIVCILVVIQIQPFVDVSSLLEKSIAAKFLLPIFADFVASTEIHEEQAKLMISGFYC